MQVTLDIDVEKIDYDKITESISKSIDEVYVKNEEQLKKMIEKSFVQMVKEKYDKQVKDAAYNEGFGRWNGDLNSDKVGSFIKEVIKDIIKESVNDKLKEVINDTLQVDILAPIYYDALMDAIRSSIHDNIFNISNQASMTARDQAVHEITCILRDKLNMQI